MPGIEDKIQIFGNTTFNRLAVSIIKCFYDTTVARVAEVLLESADNSLADLVRKTSLTKAQVAESLCVLCQSDLAYIELDKPVVYNAIPANIFYRLNRIRYINTMRKQFGINAESILEALFHHGKITASQLIVASYRNSESKWHLLAMDLLKSLMERRLIRRVSTKSDVDAADLFRFPSELMDIKKLDSCIEDQSFPQLPQREMFDDKDVSLFINYDAFHLVWRDELLVGRVRKLLDGHSAAVYGAVLKIAASREDPWRCEETFTLQHVSEVLPNHPYIAMHARILCEEEELLSCLEKVDERGEYRATVPLACQKLCLEAVNSGLAHLMRTSDTTGEVPRDIATFSRILQDGYVRSTQTISKSVLIEEARTEKCCFRLMKNASITTDEIGTTNMMGPAATYYTAINLRNVRSLSMNGFLIIYNLLDKRKQILEKHRILINKKNRIDEITRKLREAGELDRIEEVEEQLSAKNRSLVEKVHRHADEILISVDNVSQDIFVLQLYVKYYLVNNPN